MESQKDTAFFSLTPEVLDKNQDAYNKALDFALSNDDIKNIAITGIYGAGKTTVWQTYLKEKRIKNVITISLGKYQASFTKDEEKQGKERRGKK